ncbi:XdhC family protein [Rhodococcus olei]|uniref:XdhC family protein n=1 Tax=Rhodococcus olei TaxID=2161675 RepID=A0ABP8P0X2_9NOCA
MQTSARIAELIDHRQPFVHATVVRAQPPTSAHPGDEAIVLPDGTIEGFVGGQCAESSVRTAALDVLRAEEGVLLRVLPPDAPRFPDAPGARVVVNPCLSGGALEIFLEPRLPAPRLYLVGANPTADAVADLARMLGFAVERVEEGGRVEGAVAAVVAGLGSGEAEGVRAALDAGVGYVGLVASRVRGAGVLEQLGLDDAELARVHTPAGLPIGARTAAEIAVAILAELVRAIRIDRLGRWDPAAGDVLADTATDPVCGMSVTVGPDTPRVDRDGATHWFCSAGCRDRFESEWSP